MRLKEYPFVAAVRGEKGGMVWGVETGDHAGRSAAEWANAFVLAKQFDIAVEQLHDSAVDERRNRERQIFFSLVAVF